MAKKTLLQINVTANWGSTGKIAEQIGKLVISQGWDSYVAYGRKMNASTSKLIKVGSTVEVYEHYVENRLFDNDGLASRRATNKLIKSIKELRPDIIHLHNIHDHWLNYRLLFEYLQTLDTPIVWTQHDCWGFTGGCKYYSLSNCDKWLKQCNNCPLNQTFFPLVDKALNHFENKKYLFNHLRNLTLVPVSHWLENELRKSFLYKNKIHTIYNGVDTSLFSPIHSDVKKRYGIEGRSLLIAVASVWEQRKGLTDFIQLSTCLPDTVIMLVGLNDQQIKKLPHNIIGLKRTQNVEELISLYSAADIVLNLSYEETFGLTTVEGFACGTPGIVYNTTASPELITPETGMVVETGDIDGVKQAVAMMLSNGKIYYTNACRKRAKDFFNIEERYREYLNLYEELLNK